MVKKTKGKHRLDKFYHLAKEQGYRSRAAFKIIQLNRKYDFFSGARNLLDLCAAPGGWCQVAVKNMPVGSLILGVDLAPIKPIHGVRTFIGDITTQKCRQTIRKEAKGQLMDVVLHDGAPNVGGAWSSEAYSQSWLVLESLRMATDVLAPKGTFITKVFRSKDYSALLYAMNQLFTKVEATKPAASRNASAEIFVVCQGYKAPAKIDPRLLDAKYLFQEVMDPVKAAGPDALLKTKIKQRRFREGYEEGLSTSRKVISAAAFIAADNPVELLGQYTSLALDGDASKGAEIDGVDDVDALATLVRTHPGTNTEIRLLCDDLQVLGRSEFKQLLKWRLSVKKDMQKIAAADDDEGKKGKKKSFTAATAHQEGSSSDEEDEDEEPVKDKATQLEDQLLDEMSEIKDRMDRRKKREKRRRKELKTKARVRAAQLAQAEGIGEEDGPEGLFSLSGLRTKKGAGVDGVADAQAPSDEDAAASSDDDEGSGGDSSDVDSDEERRRYDATMDEYLEESYRSWKVRQRMKDAGGGVVKKKRRRLGMDGELIEEEEVDEEDGDGQKGSSSGSEESSSEDEGEEESEQEEEEEEGGGLIVSLDEGRAGRATGGGAAANQWFSQDLFDDANLEDDDDEEEEEEDDERDVRRAKAATKRKGGSKAAVAAVRLSDDVPEEEDNDDDDNEEEDDEEEEGPVGKKRKANGYGFGPSDLVIPEKERPGFEVVPMSDSDHESDSGAEEYEALDDDAKAEVRALAKKFLRRKEKDDIMEAAYNRYAFHDTALPKWFVDDERKFLRPAPQITTEEYQAAKQEQKAIDAQPIRKVAEAKARKRKRVQAKLSQARQKAESIANQEDVPAKAKMREIEKLYAKARSGGKKKSGGGGGGGRNEQYKKRGPPLDARMRKDKRGMDAAARRNKAKGRGSGGGGKGKGGAPKGGKRR